MENLISFEDVEYLYSRENEIGLKPTNLNIESGKIYSLIGPNGSGKTTLLKVLTNVLRKQKGNIIYFNDKTYNFKQVRKYVGYIPDSEAVWENLTCQEFIFYSCQLYNVIINEEFMKMYNIWLELFDIEQRKNDLLELFSFGMKKKVQIIATLLRRPILFILDEPVFGLDPISVELLFKIMKTYISSKVSSINIEGKSIQVDISPSIIITSHQMGYVEKYTDNILFISEGNIILSDSIDNIQKHPDFISLNETFVQAAQKEDKLKLKLNLIEKLF